MCNTTKKLIAITVLFCIQCASEKGSNSENGIDFGNGPGRDGLDGWRILNHEYLEPSSSDFLSFEWDYFMVHDKDGNFTGSIGYLIANPRNSEFAGLESLVPNGGNVAIAGMFEEGIFHSEYRNFGSDNYEASAKERSFDAYDKESGNWAKMTPIFAANNQEDHLVLEGKTDSFQWSLAIFQDWKALSSSDKLFVPVADKEIGRFDSPGIDEEWNVDIIWPRTHITGSIINKKTEKEYSIVGHGYRENAWGRWAFNQGGWDFSVLSDAENKVMCAWQTYHFDSVKLDYLDLGFIDNGSIQLEHFSAEDNQFGWDHPEWSYHPDARQCIPLSTRAIARNQRYEVEVTATIKSNQVPMLSDLTPATEMFVIIAQFPDLDGVITNLQTGHTIEFSGGGGGEFATARRNLELEPPTDQECAEFGKQFASPFP